MKHVKGFAVISLSVIIAVVLVTGTLLFIHSIQTAKADVLEFVGWMWSDTIGWISMNCINTGMCGASDYKVIIDSDTGVMSGWAWSSNIGWISFNDAHMGACPGVICGGPRIVADEVRGWARACAGTINGDCSNPVPSQGGWDGWISFNCINTGTCLVGGVAYAVSDPPGCAYDLRGYAWGSDVVGWISFSGSYGFGSYGVTTQCPIPPLEVTSCKPTPNPALINTEVTWEAIAIGGELPYTFLWKEEPPPPYNPPNSIHGETANPLMWTYTEAGLYQKVQIEVTDDGGRVVVADCDDLRVLLKRREVRPDVINPF